MVQNLPIHLHLGLFCSPSDLLLFDVRFVHTFNCMTDIFGMHWVVLPPSRSTFLGMKEDDEEGEKRNMRPSFLPPSRNAVEKQLMTAVKLACCKCPTCLKWHLNPQPLPPPNNSGMMAYHDDVGGLPILAHNLDFNPTYLCCCYHYYYSFATTRSTATTIPRSVIFDTFVKVLSNPWLEGIISVPHMKSH